MERIIEFRGKSKSREKIIYGSYYKHLEKMGYPIGRPSDREYTHYIIHGGFADWGMPVPIVKEEVYEDSVDQYTGIDDIAGKRIYENDSVCMIDGSGKAFIGTVSFIDGAFSIASHGKTINIGNKNYSIGTAISYKLKCKCCNNENVNLNEKCLNCGEIVTEQ